MLRGPHHARASSHPYSVHEGITFDSEVVNAPPRLVHRKKRANSRPVPFGARVLDSGP
jgi:hypothetical protein